MEKAKMRQQVGTISEDKKAVEYLANERTFLAWIRTSIAIMSLGFVVAKFGLWLNELGSPANAPTQAHRTSASGPMGIAMAALGGVLAVLAAWRYHVVNRAIEHGEVKADRGLVWLVTIMVALLALAMLIYILITVEHP